MIIQVRRSNDIDKVGKSEPYQTTFDLKAIVLGPVFDEITNPTVAKLLQTWLQLDYNKE